MWIYFGDAALSIVKHNSLPNMLLVRSRTEGDIEKVFPSAVTNRIEMADYMFRANIHNGVVSSALGKRVLAISYPNFKNSADSERSSIYFDIYNAALPLAKL